MAKAANFLPAEQRMTAEMTDESVCPEGKEKSVGFFISNDISSVQQGLGRATRFLSTTLPASRPMSIPHRHSRPYFLYFFEKSRAADMAIHIIPLFPSVDMMGINASKNGQKRLSLIK